MEAEVAAVPFSVIRVRRRRCGSGCLRNQLHKRIALNLRGEVFRDRDSNRTGTAQTLLAATGTFEFKITDALFARVEGRYDQSGVQTLYVF